LIQLHLPDGREMAVSLVRLPLVRLPLVRLPLRCR
jgi:hypothetical protein